MTTMTATTTQVYQVFIKASPEQIWEAITKPEFTSRYFYGSHVDSSFESGTPYRGWSPDRQKLWVDGEVLDSDPPRRLSYTWRALYDEETAGEEPSRVTWEIEPQDGSVSKLTVVHDQLENAPKTAENVAGGWMYILSGMKTLLETGEPLSS
jgi:uncharacterized protein YndB with AHSA1/START domain